MDPIGPIGQIKGRPRRVGRSCFAMEPLESRRMLSASSSSTVITPSIDAATANYGGLNASVSSSVTSPRPLSSALTPNQIAAAYQISLSSTTGANQTIAIVDAYNDPNIRADLAAFDAQYNLPAANLTIVNQSGQTGTLPATDAGWSLEIALDVEWAHAAAPGARIVLVEANSASTSDLMAAVQTAANMSSVVSMSWGGSEFRNETMYDTAAYFGRPNVTFLAASGDDGGAAGAEWPAVSPYVVSVGGSTLSVTSSGTTRSETAWSASGSWGSGFSGSTGGVSLYESAPSYQMSALSSSLIRRVTPDVSANANPNTGLSVYDSVSGAGQTGWFQIGGTSAGAPVWAGIVAAADQARAALGKAALSSSQTLSLLYSTYRTASYASTFHDITAGANFVARAQAGYDLVTGLGSPNASSIVAAAARYNATTSSTFRNLVTTSTPISTTHRTAHVVTSSDSIVSANLTASSVQVATSSVATADVNATMTAPVAQATAASSSPTTSSITDTATLAARPVQPLPTIRASRSSSTTDETISEPEANELTPSLPPDVTGEAGANTEEPLPTLETGQEIPYPVWDAAVERFFEMDPEFPAIDLVPVQPPLEAPGADSTASANLGALAGLAVAVWGTWKYRSTDPARFYRKALAALELPAR